MEDDFNFLNGEFKKAKRGVSGGSLTSKFLVAIPAILTSLYRGGWADLDELEKAHTEVTGRWRLTFGAGVGGVGGVDLIRNGKDVKAYADNILNLAGRLKAIEPAALVRWMQSVGLDNQSFAKWLASLPRA